MIGIIAGLCLSLSAGLFTMISFFRAAVRVQQVRRRSFSFCVSRLIPPRPSVSDVEFICARDLLYCRPQVGQSSLITGRVCVLRLCRSTGGNKTGSSFKASAMICSFVWVVANPAKRNGRQKHGHQHCDNQHNVHVSPLESCSNGNGPCRRPDNRRQKMRSLFLFPPSRHFMAEAPPNSDTFCSHRT